MHTRMCLAIKQNIEYSEYNKLVSYTIDELTEDWQVALDSRSRVVGNRSFVVTISVASVKD